MAMEEKHHDVKRASTGDTCESNFRDGSYEVKQRDSGDLDEKFIANRPDPAEREREKVVFESYKVATGKNISNFIQVLSNSLGLNYTSEQLEEEKTPNVDKEPLTIKHTYSAGCEEPRAPSLSLSPQSIQKKRAMEESEHVVKHAYYHCTFETSTCGNIDAVGRDCGDYIEIKLYKGLILNNPGWIIAAVGGIPDELKIENGLSFSYPCPTIKIHKDPAAHQLDEAMGMGAFPRTLLREYRKAIGIGSISDHLELEKEEAHNKYHESLAMIEVNAARSPDMFEFTREGVIDGYSICSMKGCQGDGTVKMLQRDCGDHVELLLYDGVIVNKPRIVIAAGGIPNELKINGGISVSYPCPTMKVRKDLLFDPARRRKALHDAFVEVWGPDAYKKNIIQAYKKARLSSSSVSEQSENMDQQPLAMIEVSLASSPQGTRSSSEELNKDMEK